jgi:hypothetical protein
MRKPPSYQGFAREFLESADVARKSACSTVADLPDCELCRLRQQLFDYVAVHIG